jgi:hypothetical protein
LLPALIIAPVVSADPSSEETTLYFHEYYFETGEGNIDQNFPTKENDSALPPLIGESEEFLGWLSIWFIAIGMQHMDPADLGMTEEEYLLFLKLMESLGEELWLNPFKIKETFTYSCEESVNVEGNVVFDLYFLSYLGRLRSEIKDSMNINLYLNDKKIDNINITFEPKAFDGKVQGCTATIKDVDFSLEYGDELAFSVEILYSNKTIVDVIKKGGFLKERSDEDLKDILVWFADFLIKIENFPDVQLLGETVKLFLNESEVLENLPLKDLAADFVNTVISSSFVYDSTSHPSSVTLPAKLLDEDENTKIYYLHDGNEMDEEKPMKDASSSSDLSENSPKWDGPKLYRSKILKKARASLYISHQDLNIINTFLLRNKIKVVATLFDGDILISSSEKEFDRTTIQNFLETSDNPLVVFAFDNLNDREVTYNSSLSLKISVDNDTKFGSFDLFRNINLLYDSNNCPSSLKVELEETDHIKMEISADPSNEKVVPGGNVKYTINITSDSEDDTKKKIGTLKLVQNPFPYLRMERKPLT